MNAVAQKANTILKSKWSKVTAVGAIVLALGMFFQPLINEKAGELINFLSKTDLDNEPVSNYIDYPNTPTDNNKHYEDIGTIFVTEKEIITGSDDNLIKVWQRNGQLKYTLSYHISDIQTIDVQGDLVVSGSNDKIIIIWNRKTNKIKRLYGHNGSIFKVLIHNGKIYSASADATIKVWDLESGKLLDTLTEHSGKIYDLAIIQEKLISISKDKTVRIWNIDSHKMEGVLRGHSREIRGLAASENGMIVTADSQKNMILWDLTSRTKRDEIKTLSRIRMNELLIHNDTIISASGESPIVYVYTNKKPITITKKMDAGKFDIESLFNYKRCLFGGTTEGTIAVWDIKTGSLLYEIKGTPTKKLDICL